MGTGELSEKPDEMLEGTLAMDQHLILGGSSNTPRRFMLHEKKVRLGGLVGSSTNFTFTSTISGMNNDNLDLTGYS